MKVIQFIRPIDQKKRQELERQLAAEKRRFRHASREVRAALRYDFSLSHWLEDYPIESALVVLAGGFVLGRLASSRRS